MLKQIKTLGLVIVIGSMMVGCSGEKFEVTLEGYETEIENLIDVYNNTEIKTDNEDNEQILESLNGKLDELEDVKADLDKELDKYDRNTDEYKLLDELYDVVEELEDCYKVSIEVLTIDQKGSVDTTTFMATAFEAANNMLEMEEEIEEYKNLKKELGIGEVLESTEVEEEQPEAKEETKQEVKEESKAKEETKQEVKEESKAKEETKSVEEQSKQDPNKYEGECMRCGKHTMCDNIMGTCDDCEGYGQCYDCGEYKLTNNMTYDGRLYHCGCKDKVEEIEDSMVPDEFCVECGLGLEEGNIYYGHGAPLCVDCYNNIYLAVVRCSNCGGDVEDNGYVHEGKDYCVGCYNALLNEIYGGPAQ